MPRLARKQSKSNYYHIMVQGINKEYIFKYDNFIQVYKDIIVRKLEGSNITILAYCIMNNHAHFLIHSKEIKDLSKFMQRINTAYSHFYNSENNRVGFVFRDRYLSQDILNKKQLYTCLKYIHNNPVKAQMVKNMSEYKYSSYNEFFGKKQIITYESLKLLFGSSKNFIDEFNYIHNNIEDEKFIDIKEKNINDFIIDFENNYNVSIKNINNTSMLKSFINEAREQTDVTLVQLGKLLGISKSKVGNLTQKG